MNDRTAKNNLSVNTLGVYRSDSITASLSDYHGGLKQSWHSHDEFILTLNLKGYAREEVGCRDVVINPFSIGIKPVSLKHTDHFWATGLRAIRISLSQKYVSELKSEALIKERWDWLSYSPAIRPFLRIGSSLLNNKTSEAEISDGISEILAALLPVRNIQAASGAPLWLRRAKENLDASYADGIRLTHLARQSDVHPVYFARQFRRFFGCSVGRYIRRLQFQSIISLLTAKKISLAQIACQIGFSDQAHMTRALADEFGITPAQFRRLLV